MNETKNKQLAREITKFCKEQVKSPALASKSSKSLLQTLLVVSLTATLSSIPVEPDRRIAW